MIKGGQVAIYYPTKVETILIFMHNLIKVAIILGFDVNHE
jgi:hypothetical protein